MHGCVPMDVVRVPLSNGGIALIDRVDWFAALTYHARNGLSYYLRPCDRTWRRTTSTKWQYAVTDLKHHGHRATATMHRLVMRAEPGHIVDHINGDRFDNLRSNLRFCTHQQNIQNMAIRGGTSQYKGVCHCPSHRGTKKWRAQINRYERRTFLGYFRLEEAAARRYDEAAVELFGEFANLNFPQLIEQ